MDMINKAKHSWLDTHNFTYHQTSNIICSSESNKIVYHSDVVRASPVGGAPTTSSFSTWHLSSVDWSKKATGRDENYLSFGIWYDLYIYKGFYGHYVFFKSYSHLLQL